MGPLGQRNWPGRDAGAGQGGDGGGGAGQRLVIGCDSLLAELGFGVTGLWT